MATQSLSYTPLGAYIDFVTGNVYVDVSFTDSVDLTTAGFNRYTLPASGPIQDSRGRVVAASTPSNITTAATTTKTNILAALTTGDGLGKIKP